MMLPENAISGGSHPRWPAFFWWAMRGSNPRPPRC